MEKYVRNLFTDAVLHRSARLFNIDPHSLKPISDVENFVFGGLAGDQPLILRITHSSHRTPELLLGELDWIKFLQTNGMSVPQALQSIHGNWVEVAKTAQTHFLVTAFNKLEGVNIIDANLCSPALYQKWGEMLGKMHRLAQQYVPQDESCKRLEWCQNELVSQPEKYISDQATILKKYKSLIDRLGKLPQNTDSYGLIHTDFTDVNFFVHDQKISIFDFDDCEYHWFVYDIAVILFENLAWLPQQKLDKEEFARFFYNHFIEGYEKENHLDEFWFKQLTDFIKLREIFLYIAYHKRWDLDNLDVRQSGMLQEYKFNIENDIPYLNVEKLTSS
ncbi:MAG: phosphotransferase [Anaerolineales bacterium]|nr:phosphotransferase [Anaerolineales bacterium]